MLNYDTILLHENYVTVVFGCVLKWERTENILRELNFWLSNIFVSNKKNLCGVTETHVIVYSDASNVTAGAYTIELNQKVFHSMWKKHETDKKSTWRELRAVEQTWCVFKLRKP